MAKVTTASSLTREEQTPLCVFCAVVTEKKKVFSKEVYKCPQCKKSTLVDASLR